MMLGVWARELNNTVRDVLGAAAAAAAAVGGWLYGLPCVPVNLATEPRWVVGGGCGGGGGGGGGGCGGCGGGGCGGGGGSAAVGAWGAMVMVVVVAALTHYTLHAFLLGELFPCNTLTRIAQAVCSSAEAQQLLNLSA